MANLQFDKDMIEMSIMLQKMDEKKQSNLYKLLIKKGAWVLRAIESHAEAYNLSIDKNVQIMILFIADSVVGHAVKYVALISEWASVSGQTMINWEIFTMHIFPFGYPDFTTKKKAA